MHRARLSVVSLTLLTVAACGRPAKLTPLSVDDDDADADDDGAAVDDSEDPVDGVEDGDGDVTPPVPAVPDVDFADADAWALRCAGEALDDGTWDIVRVAVRGDLDADTVVAVIARGPQFLHHGLEDIDDVAPQPVTTLTLRSVGDVFVDDAGVLTIPVLATPGEIVTAMVGAVGVSCWSDAGLFGDGEDRGGLGARFDVDTGRCLDAQGAPARNTLPLPILRETGFAECVDVHGRINGSDFGYPELRGFNFAGANLDDAQLHFANLRDARLQGADLGTFAFGYAEIEGVIDDATTLPEDCAVDGDAVFCRR